MPITTEYESVSLKDAVNSFDTYTYERAPTMVGKTFSKSEKSTFKSPNREEEDKLVAEFQRTGDPRIHAKLFEIRQSTIEVWTKKYAWIYSDERELFSELCMVWLKCVQKYKYGAEMRTIRTRSGAIVRDKNNKVQKTFKRTPFNTFLYTSLKNHILNLIKKKYSQKRLDDNGHPVEFGMKSLDYEFGEDGSTLYDIIEDPKPISERPIGAEWVIDEISRGDMEVRDVLVRFLKDGLKNIKTACSMRSGSLNLSRGDREILVTGGEKACAHLSDMIAKSGEYGDNFIVKHYQVYYRSVSFSILQENAPLKRKVMAAIKSAKERLKK